MSKYTSFEMLLNTKAFKVVLDHEKQTVRIGSFHPPAAAEIVAFATKEGLPWYASTDGYTSTNIPFDRENIEV